MKINRGHLISVGIHSIKFGNFQAEGSKDIEQTSLGLQTDDRPTKSCRTIFPLFSKDSIKIAKIMSW